MKLFNARINVSNVVTMVTMVVILDVAQCPFMKDLIDTFRMWNVCVKTPYIHCYKIAINWGGTVSSFFMKSVVSFTYEGS